MVCSNVGMWYIASMINKWKWHYSNGGIITDRGKPKYSKKSLPPLPLCPPQIPYGLPYHGTWASHVISREQTARITSWGLRSWFWVAMDPRHITWRAALRGRPAARLPGSLRRHWNVVNMGLLTRVFNTRKNFSEIYSQFWQAPCPRKTIGQCLATFTTIKFSPFF